MNDRELLELAALAAGIVGVVKSCADGDMWLFHDGANSPWNPLANDGDALRLAVELEIDIWHGKWPNGKKYAAAHKVWCSSDSMYYDDGVSYKNDKMAATRRAIVRAAAEIGKAMQ